MTFTLSQGHKNWLLWSGQSATDYSHAKSEKASVLMCSTKAEAGNMLIHSFENINNLKQNDC